MLESLSGIDCLLAPVFCLFKNSMINLHHKYDGLIFDMDGTLADTMPTHFIAWSRSMSAQGIEFTKERFYALGGVPAALIVEMLAEEQGKKVDVRTVAEAKEVLQRLLHVRVAGRRLACRSVAIDREGRDHTPLAQLVD